jgi:hypothetical protein
MVLLAKTGTKKAKPFESNLPMPLRDFLAHVRKLSVFVSRYAIRMSALSGKRISARTAKQLVQLVEELERIDAERDRIAIGTSRDIVREASDLVTTIGMAARFAAQDHPVIAERLKRVRRGKQRRSAAAVVWALEMHIGLVKKNAAELGKLIPKTTLRDAERLRAALDEHNDRVKNRRDVNEEVSKRRADILRELRTISANVRALAAITFRAEPEIARQFQLPKRRTPRARVSRTPPTPPTPA